MNTTMLLRAITKANLSYNVCTVLIQQINNLTDMQTKQLHNCALVNF